MIGDWINLLRNEILKSDPSILNIFEVYASEAEFGRKFINSNLKHLPRGSSILEIGGGSLILSSQLVREGFSVTSVEPIGNGFFHFYKMRKLILKQAKYHNCLPINISKKAEDFYCNDLYDFAFSINVMEHVDSIHKVIINVIKSLKKGCTYRFTCPNYFFPYEPHFNIPTLFNKSLTWLFFQNFILNKKEISDSMGLWKSLNWISFFDLFSLGNKNNSIKISYNKKILDETLERLFSDKQFSLRRSPWVRMLVKCIVLLRLHKLFSYLPLIFQPIMDCSIEKIFFEQNNNRTTQY